MFCVYLKDTVWYVAWLVTDCSAVVNVSYTDLWTPNTLRLTAETYVDQGKDGKTTHEDRMSLEWLLACCTCSLWPVALAACGLLHLLLVACCTCSLWPVALATCGLLHLLLVACCTCSLWPVALAACAAAINASLGLSWEVSCVVVIVLCLVWCLCVCVNGTKARTMIKYRFLLPCGLFVYHGFRKCLLHCIFKIRPTALRWPCHMQALHWLSDRKL
jgi:hypothetical protein